MSHPFPLRITLPLGLLLIGLTMLGIGVGFNQFEILRRNSDLAQQRSAAFGAFVTPEFEQVMRTAADPGVAALLARVEKFPYLSHAVLCDDAGLVVGASEPALVGQPLTRAAAWAQRLRPGARAAGTSWFLASPDRGTLWSAFPIHAPDGATVWLYTESDVASQLAPALTSLYQRASVLAALIVFVCGAAWFYFDRTVTRRANTLVAATEAFAAGASAAQKVLSGSDELARLDAAFARMAEQVRARDATIQRNEERLAHALRGSELGAWDWDLTADTRLDDPLWSAMLGYGPDELGPRAAARRALVHPDDAARVQAALGAHLAGRSTHYECEHRLRHRDGHWRWVSDKGQIVGRTLAGLPLRMVGTTRDITGRKEAELLVAEQRDLLEHIATGHGLSAALDAVCRFAESKSAGWLCSILVLDGDSLRLRHGAAPSLPPDYCRALDGTKIGPNVGSCGTAAYRRAPVIVTDIATDPLWVDYRDLAAAHGLKACWSTPIPDAGAGVLGTFAIYAREIRHPAPAQEEIIRIATHAAAIALQRARAETSLRASEELFQKAFRSSPVGMVFSTLEEGRIVAVNDAFLRLVGHANRDEVIGRTGLELRLWPDPADRTRLRKHLAESAKVTGVEQAFCTKSGELRHALGSAELVELQGQPCILLLIFDITDRKVAQSRVEQADRQRERQLALLEASLDSLVEGVIVSELDGRLFYWNRAALALHGYASLDECRRRLGEFADTFEFVLRDGATLPVDQWPLSRILAGEVLRNWEGTLRHRRAGWTRLFLYSGSLVRDAAGQPLLAVVSMVDLTEHRQLEERLRQSQKMDAIGQLAGGIAHDFNNILTALLVRTELAEAQPGLPAKTVEAFAEIRHLGDRAAGLTGQLLAYSRRSLMELRHLDLNDVVSDDTRLLRRTVGEDIALELRLHGHPLPILADGAMVGQVLLNLAINARDAMPNGGRLLLETGELVVTSAQARVYPDATPGRYATLRVTDSGTGIAPEIVDRIFEPFFTTKPVGKGTGLGLSTVFGIVRQLHGAITVASRPGDGATFLVLLPIVEAPATLPDSAKPPPADRRGSETILVVEDEPIVRDAVRQLLEGQGYRVLVAEDGLSAIVAWERQPREVALLLTDLVMPGGMSGRELAAQLRTGRPDMQVVFMTGYSADISAGALASAGRHRLLQKPFTPESLLEAVRGELDAK